MVSIRHRAASHASRHCAVVSPAAWRLCRLLARRLPPSLTRTRPPSRSAVTRASSARRDWSRRCFWNRSACVGYPFGSRPFFRAARSSRVSVSAVGWASRFSIAAMAARSPAVCRSWASRALRYWASFAAMTAFAHRPLDSAVRSRLRAFEPVPARLPPPGLARPRGRRDGTADPGQVGAPQPAQVPGHRVQHRLIGGRGPQPGRDRRAGRPGHGLHPAPLPQPHRRHPLPPRWPPVRRASRLPPSAAKQSWRAPSRQAVREAPCRLAGSGRNSRERLTAGHPGTLSACASGTGPAGTGTCASCMNLTPLSLSDRRFHLRTKYRTHSDNARMKEI